MLTKINYEVKGQLAKLLATEDLIIENHRVETAMFDVERRVLTLPMWEKASASVYDLLVGHRLATHYTHQQITGRKIIQIYQCLMSIFLRM